MVGYRTRGKHQVQLLEWSVLAFLLVHLMSSHCVLGPLAHMPFIRPVPLSYHAAVRSYVPPAVVEGARSPVDQGRLPLPGVCDELVGAHTAIVQAPFQFDEIPQVALLAFFFNADLRVWWVRLHSFVPPRSSFSVCSLYLQLTALLI